MAISIASEELSTRIGCADAPLVLDVRTEADFRTDARLLPRCVRSSHVAERGDLPAGRVVVVCRKGGKLSQGLASLLEAEGTDAAYLEGGTDGWTGPTLAASALPPSGLWVGRDDADGAALRWAVCRFAPPAQRVLLVEPGEVDAAAERFAAVAASDLQDFCRITGLSGPALSGLGARLPVFGELIEAARRLPNGAAAILDAAYALEAVA